ncbi:MAG: AMP phosphorylase, partial [Desulfurococcus sp.]
MGFESKSKLFNVKIIDLDIHRNLIIMNSGDAEELGVVTNNIVLVTAGDYSAYAMVITSRTVTQPGVVALSTQTASALRVSEG